MSLTHLFILLAVLAFCGFGFNARRGNGHLMVYSAMLVVVWIAAALWWSGRFG